MMSASGTPRSPERTRFARREFARLAYAVSGDGETTVLLLHDLLGDRATMRGVRDALIEAGFRVVAPDARGHGASAAVSGLRFSIAELALDLLAILDAEAINQVQVIGLGLGATTGLDLALAAPERVGRVVLIDPSVPGVLRDDADPEVRAAAAEAAAATAKIADLATKGASDRALDLYFMSRHGPDWRTSLAKSHLAAIRRHANAFGPLLHASNDYRPAEDAMRGRSGPALILVHEDRSELDRLAANRLHGRLAGSRLETIGESEVLESAIVRFLEQDGDGDRRPHRPEA